MKKLILTVAVFGLLGVNAKAAEDCNLIQMSGNYKTNTGAKVSLMQNGCQVLAKDYQQKVIWKLDMSGNTQIKVPLSIVEKNKDTQLGYHSLKSLSFNTTLDKNLENCPNCTDPVPKFIVIKGTMNLPKVESNKFDVDVEFSGKIFLGTHAMTSTTNGGAPIYYPGRKVRVDGHDSYEYASNGKSTSTYPVDYLQLQDLKFHILRVNDNSLTGKLAEAFIMGANYILDGWNLSVDWMVGKYLNIERVK